MLVNKVRELRKRIGMSQTELGLWMNMSNSGLSEIERGLKRINQDSIPTFCRVLKCTPNDLFGFKSSPDEITINLDLHQRLLDALGKLSPERQLEEIMKIEVSADIIKKNRI